MAEEKTKVTIYTDGGADPNPGPGGWGVVLIHDQSGKRKELSGGELDATNNRMELMGAIRGLEALTRPCEVTLYTDSEYVYLGMTERVEKWRANGWRRDRNQPVNNLDLWKQLVEQAQSHAIEWRWVKGHAGNKYNDIADRLATTEIRKIHAALNADDTDGAEIYTLVSARGKVGFWAALVRFEGEEDFQYGFEKEATANKLDILAAATALSLLPDEIHVSMYTFSDYLRNGATKWIGGWVARDWRTKDGQPVKNMEEWQWLQEELAIRDVKWPIVKKDDPPAIFESLGLMAQEAFEEMGRYETPGNEEV